MKLTENASLAGRYHLERRLGKGGFSEVWLAADTLTPLRFAIKAGARNNAADSRLRSLADEYALLYGLSHDNLLLPLFYEEYEQTPCLILPYCENGSPAPLAGKLSEAEAIKIMRNIAAALHYLHSQNPPLVHCDVKPANIIAGPNGQYLLSDFGICHQAHPSAPAPAVSAGTPAYMAPERFIRNASPAAPSDIFSLGATIYELLSGAAPFGEKGGIELHHGATPPPIAAPCSPQLKTLIARCLDKNPACRPSPLEIQSIIHPVPSSAEPSAPQARGKLSGHRQMLVAWAAIALLSLLIIALLAWF
jgi:serine/threonine protein kinase